MSFYKLPSLDRYWNTDVLDKGVPVRCIMTRDQFKAILAFLQVVPPTDIDQGDLQSYTFIFKKFQNFSKLIFRRKCSEY